MPSSLANSRVWPLKPCSAKNRIEPCRIWSARSVGASRFGGFAFGKCFAGFFVDFDFGGICKFMTVGRKASCAINRLRAIA